MRHLILAGVLLAMPALAWAQDAAQPVTLSPQEYQQVITALAQRDPVITLLMSKQSQAQQAKKAAVAEDPQSPK